MQVDTGWVVVDCSHLLSFSATDPPPHFTLMTLMITPLLNAAVVKPLEGKNYPHFTEQEALSAVAQ